MSIYKDLIQSEKPSVFLHEESVSHGQLESTRSLHHRIDNNLTEGNGIVFTGMGSNIGTTYILMNLVRYLSLTLKQMNLRILLIDGNTHTGALNQQLGVENRPGLFNFFQEDFNPEMIHKDVMPGVDFLPAGTAEWNLPDISNPEIKTRAEDLFKKYNYVLVDAPPMFVHSDALILGAVFRHFVLVMEYGKSKLDVVLEARKRLEDNGSILIGGVINRLQHTIPDFIYKRI
jgi:Mrp family chromosome partitioning ATPase